MPRSTERCYFMLTSFILILTFTTITFAYPTDNNEEVTKRPLIEFRKGAIRLNFGGYHAEAGLGGLLTGSRTGGGLHVSAGAPSGAHASAGLGGILEDGGGLHARAGLGNGGPEVKTGLGGIIGGSSKTGDQTTGVLYADSNLKDFNVPKIEKGQKHEYSKNIQVIPRPNKGQEEKDKNKDSMSLVSTANKDIDEAVKTLIKDDNSLKKTESQIPTGLGFAFGNPDIFDKKEVLVDEKVDVKSNAIEKTSSSTADIVAKIENSEDPNEKNSHPARWYFKKRLRERTEPAKKYIYEANEFYNSDRPARQRKAGLFVRSVNNDNNDRESGTSGNVWKNRGGTLFDDIFNIPISALNAVNQLLKNNVGKK